jgi:hypothetical protein
MSSKRNHVDHQSHTGDHHRRGRRSAFETFTDAITAPAEAVFRLGGERRPRRPHDV